MNKSSICILLLGLLALTYSTEAAKLKVLSRKFGRSRNVVVNVDDPNEELGSPAEIAELLANEPLSAKIPTVVDDVLGEGEEGLADALGEDLAGAAGGDAGAAEVDIGEDDDDSDGGLELPPGVDAETLAAVNKLKAELAEAEAAIQQLKTTIKEEKIISEKLVAHEAALKKLEEKQKTTQTEIDKKVLEAHLKKHETDLSTLQEMKQKLKEKGDELGTDEGLIKGKIASTRAQITQLLGALGQAPAATGAVEPPVDVLGPLGEEIKKSDAITTEHHEAAKKDVEDFIKNLEAGVAASA